MAKFVQHIGCITDELLTSWFGEGHDRNLFDFTYDDAVKLHGLKIDTACGRGSIKTCIVTVTGVEHPCGYDCCGYEYYEYELNALVELDEKSSDG